MSASAFVDYALSLNLSPDEIYTVELLIDTVQYKFDPKYWDGSSERNDARDAPGYTPSFSKDHVAKAAVELQTLSWVSFQRQRSSGRPVRNLNALRYLPELSGLALNKNDITDIGALRHCGKLRRLHLSENPIRDISPLAECLNLEELDVRDTPIEDFSFLQSLPKLRNLEITVEQLPVLRKAARLPHLKKLDVGLGKFDSFDGFPAMPELRIIWGACANSLSGLERYPKLENLVNFSGEFDSLEPLRELKRLTHINILNSRVKSLTPLSGLVALRAFRIASAAERLDLTSLELLPALHDVSVKYNESEHPLLAKLRAELPSWDVEFLSRKARHTPSLEIEVVDQETFDYYDNKQPFGLVEAEVNHELLSSELEWLDEKFEGVFAVDFVADEDYAIPFQWGGARSRTIVLVSERAIEAFPRLVLGMQEVLCRSNNDWIIYLEAEDGEFIVWVYPDKILVTEKYAENVRRLIEGY